ncbi:hypothetical protein D0962_36015 [Leptolyngbyaceae cyanobacterium CCMR0082]|uniref:Uncharacterized protein n=2 Tax=Adonisia TaxID=2950183 RepID=A0A6M0SHU1_9CYAN|nr:hypothetical protein [Adonisia turfae CCMR0082]
MVASPALPMRENKVKKILPALIMIAGMVALCCVVYAEISTGDVAMFLVDADCYDAPLISR